MTKKILFLIIKNPKILPISPKLITISSQFFYCTSTKITQNPNKTLEQSIDFTPQDFTFLKTRILGPADPHFSPGKSSNDAFLISNCINDNNSVFSPNTQKCLRKFRDNLSESLVIEVIKLVKTVNLSVEFFIWAGQQVGYFHTSLVCDALLDVICCGENDGVYKDFLREIGEDDRVILEKVLNLMVRKCCVSGMWDLALEELNRLRGFGFKPSRVTFNCVVRVFLEAGKLDAVRMLHRDMVSERVNLDISTLNCFVFVLCKKGEWREALELIEKEGFVPDTKCYASMISGLCKGSFFSEALDFLNEMRSRSSLPNAVTYGILVCECLRRKWFGKCKEVLHMMMKEGCFPSRKIFNAVVDAYCKLGDYSYCYNLMKKMDESGCEPSYVVYNVLIGGICGKKEFPSTVDLDLAEKVYTEMLDHGLVLNKVNVRNFTRCLCEAGKYEKAYNVVQEMMSKGFVPSHSTCSNVIDLLCNRSQVEKAFLLFEQMKKSGVVPSVYTYTVMIDGFCKAGLVAQARKLFNEMSQINCSPNVVTYTALVHGYLKVRKIDDANLLFEMMVSNGCAPNIVTYNALIDGHCKSGNIDKACQIYTRMRGEENLSEVDMYFKVNSTEKSVPDVFTYGALVDGLCKAHKVGDACNLIDTMFTDGCEPNPIVYNALIDGFCKAGDLEKAQNVYTKMSKRGCSPTLYTYDSLMDTMFKHKRLDLAMALLNKMGENGFTPNVVTYTVMIDGLCKSQKTGEAYKLLLAMENKGCRPNVVTYTVMIDGFGKAGKIEKCLDLFKTMKEKGCAPTYVTYRVMINHCCCFGLLDEAYNLLEEMKQTYWPMNVASYQKVIAGFNQEFITSIGLLDTLSDIEQMPIAPVYKVLVDSFCKAGRLEIAAQLCKELSSSASFSAATNPFSSTIKSLCLASKVDEACELFTDMVRNGGVPEPSVFFDLITRLLKVDCWEVALQILDGACQMEGNNEKVS